MICGQQTRVEPPMTKELFDQSNSWLSTTLISELTVVDSLSKLFFHVAATFEIWYVVFSSKDGIEIKFDSHTEIYLLWGIINNFSFS